MLEHKITDISPALSDTNMNREQRKDTQNSTNLDETHMLWKMRWCFFWIGGVFCIFWIAGILVVSIIILCITKSFLSLFLSAGSALPLEFFRRFANFLLPMNEKSFELSMQKLGNSAEKQQANPKLVSKQSHLPYL